MNNLQLSGQRINSTDSLSDPLVQAAETGDLETVNDLLTHGIDLNAPDNHVHTALRVAAFNGHTDIVKALLASGASPDESAALLSASIRGSLEIVNLLLDYRADPNIGGRFGTTALQHAASLGYLDIAIALLGKGASLDKADRYGHTALYEAVSHGHLNVVKALLARGARPDKFPIVLVAAAMNGNLAVVEELLAHGANPDTPEMFGSEALEVALLFEHRKIVDILLDKVARSSPGALCQAAVAGYLPAVQKLLDLGTDPNPPPFGTTPLCSAAYYGHLDVVHILLEHGADPDVPANTGSALYQAASSGHTDIVNALLAKGVEPNESPGALVEAVVRGDQAMVEILLAHGADPDIPDQADLVEEDGLALYKAFFEEHVEIFNTCY